MTRAASPASNINTSPPVPAPHMAPTIPPASPRRICQWNTFPYLQSVTAAESSTTNKTAKGRHLPSLFLLFSGILPRSWGFRRNCRSCPGRTPGWKWSGNEEAHFWMCSYYRPNRKKSQFQNRKIALYIFSNILQKNFIQNNNFTKFYPKHWRIFQKMLEYI